MMPTMTKDRLYVLQMVMQENGSRSAAFVGSIADVLKVCGDDGPVQYVAIIFDVEYAAEHPEMHPLDLVMDCPLFSVQALRAHFEEVTTDGEA